MANIADTISTLQRIQGVLKDTGQVILLVDGDVTIDRDGVVQFRLGPAVALTYDPHTGTANAGDRLPETVQERARRGDPDAVARMQLAGQLDPAYLTEAGLDHLALTSDQPLPTGDGPMAKKYTFPLSVTVERTDGPPVDEDDVLSALKEEIEQLEFDCGDESSVFTVDTAASA